jgi:hypothetical protein
MLLNFTDLLDGTLRPFLFTRDIISGLEDDHWEKPVVAKEHQLICKGRLLPLATDLFISRGLFLSLFFLLFLMFASRPARQSTYLGRR